MPNLTKIEGVGATNAKKMAKAGIRTTDGLLKLCCSKKGRKQAAADSGISEKLILRWANMADLFRIKGVGEEYSDLLEAAGVDTVPELSQRKPENLHQKMAEVNTKKKLVRQLPTLAQVEGWVAQAKELPRMITH